MIYRQFRVKSYRESGKPYPGTHIDVFRKHFAEASHGVVHLAAEPHVESARGEFFKAYLSTAYPTCGQERGHGMVYGFLGRCERGIGGVGASETVVRMPV